MRVGRLDEIDFPRPVPVLQLLLAGYRRKHVPVHFEPDQPFDAVLVRKPRLRALAVLPQAAFEVGCYTDVQRAPRLARKDIHAGVAFTAHRADFAARWTLKQVQGDGLGMGR